ncbi:MAG: ABC transporter ATP-binding protein [Polyangiaceae bacterium]|nr:ABC transporter ATP-binding protein [Polyangiaceae bacterium]
MADAAERPLLRVEAAVKEYGERVKTVALAGVDLSLDAGEFAALVGPSGSGKSTLLNLVGLLDRPTSGRIWLGDTETTALDEAGLTAVRARMLGFVFQFHHLLPAFTAVENVMLPEWGDTGFASKALRRRAEELLHAVGLADRMSYRTTDLSGGQQQRVAVARALVRRPPLVLADEPTGNLDTESSHEVLELMRRFNRELGTTFLVVTHDPRIADACDRVVELVDGRVESDHRAAPR